jgi:hypothetical protein
MVVLNSRMVLPNTLSSSKVSLHLHQERDCDSLFTRALGLSHTGLIEREKGNIEAALRAFQRASAINPANIYSIKQVARTSYAN